MINHFPHLVVGNGFKKTFTSLLLTNFRSVAGMSSSSSPKKRSTIIPPMEILPHYTNNQLFTHIYFGSSSLSSNGTNIAQSYTYSSRAALLAEPNKGQPGADSAVIEKPGDPKLRDPTKIVTVETSMRYLISETYKETYGENKVWVLYRRNFKGQFEPKKTRKNCFWGGRMSTGNPCPICRDEYLVLDYRNVDLLKQFISPFNGEILGTEKTGLCQNKQFILLAEIDKAKDYGTITFDVKFREYDYEEYYSKEDLEKLHSHHHQSTEN